MPRLARLFPPKRAAAVAPENAEALPRRPSPARGETILDVERARKAFGGLVAVNDVSFTVKAGGTPVPAGQIFLGSVPTPATANPVELTFTTKPH